MSLDEAHEPIDRYLRDQRYHGRSDRTIRAYDRVLRDFETFVQESTDPDSLEHATRERCMEWVHTLRNEHKSSTVASYATYVNRFYRYMVEIGAFEQNPMAIVIDQMNESIDSDPVRREITVDQMRSFIASIDHPLDRAIVVTFLKTGIRVGELCNLDLRDLHLAENPLPDGANSPRAALDGRPNALFIPDEPTRGREYNNELRSASNKRQRATIIPVDRELRLALIEWLAIRPDTPSLAEPLFADTTRNWGQRLTGASVRYRLRNHATEFGWYEPGADAAENVTPHYFRHFFTTHLRDRTGDRGIVKYLRGDVADDIIETYTHNWGDRVKVLYERHIYSLL